jgi:AraC-like DNA-binding protein
MRPGPDLLGDVMRYAGYRERGWSIRNREVAGTVVPLILSFGDPFRIRLGAAPPQDHRSFLAGLYDGYADVASTGSAHCMQIDFTPLGAYRFFAMPMGELAGQTVALDQVGAFDALIGRLHDAPDWGTRFARLDAFVRRRLAAAAPASPAIAWAWRKLVATDGLVRIGALAAEIGCSRKHLAQRFAIAVGAGPKTVGRILRFGAARRAIDAKPAGRVDWADLAGAWGYADQAHLIREFRALAGVTSVDYLRDSRFRALNQVTNLQDGIPEPG